MIFTVDPWRLTYSDCFLAKFTDCLSEELVLEIVLKWVSKNLDVAAYTVAKHITQDVTFALQLFNK